ncbi:MAG: hypothetical protein A2161_13960 [Candidatus Schekmanbacteria bacterium RBG_13_48_7]|uniref:Insertion element IS150 protein InsJ-like helix-turn-helix domain-containing protein n=1 Tax=Candidatus Schekmanbacteria bacterium RBG_13_48_7 TaxID=1817878 RepID=A0A1F7RWP7_9BACT|nr:MAG: hypothetical protein A2161_13960 [Candidatus Schekmanbacteria bacterium RBG_13_48_7]
MRQNQNRDPKIKVLQEKGTLNRNAERVKDPLFQENEFFDPRDLIQVKYEMLRRVMTDGYPVTQSAKSFGLSRPAFYKAQLDFEQAGLPGLVTKKRGPHGAYKLTEEVMDFIQDACMENPSVRTRELIDLVVDRFDLTVHRRTMERALLRLKKKLL